MRTIIAPSDFSDISTNAGNYAADMAMYLNANLLILHATESGFDVNKNFNEPGENETEIEEKLNALKNEIISRTNNNISVRTKQLAGLIENEIIKMCSYINPLAVVMATKGASIKEHFSWKV